MKHPFIRSASAAAVVTLLTLAPAAQAADLTNQQLQSEIEELKRQLLELKNLLKPAAASPGAAATSSATTEATVPGPEVATKNDIDGLRSDLENYKYEQQRARETKTTLATRGTTIGGTVQTRFSTITPSVTNGSTGGATPANPRHSSFDISQATLTFKGSLFRDYAEGKNLDYALGFQYQSNTAAGLGNTGTAANGSQLNVTDAYLRYAFFPTKTGQEEPVLNLTLGQQQIPFGLEAQTSEELRPVINQSQFVGNLGVGTRQIGLILRGDYEPFVDYAANYRAPLLEYAVGVVNGSGTNKSDDNNSKDWLARAAFTLPVDYASPFRELKFGASYYKGGKNIVNQTGSGSAATYSVLTQHGQNERRGFDIYYNHTPYGITYEFAEGRDDISPTTTGLISNRKSRGQYVTAYYTWGQQFVASLKSQAKYDDWWPQSYQLFARFDSWDPDVSKSNDLSRISTVGFNFFFAETTKFQINLVHSENQAPTTALPSHSNALYAQFQYGF